MIEQHFNIPNELYKIYQRTHIQHFKASCDMLIEEGSHIPMFLIHSNTQLHIIPCPFQNDDEKYKFLMTCKLIAYKTKASCVYFISENWYYQDTKRWEGMPIDHPNRKEGIHCILWVKDIGGRMLQGETIRSNSGKIIRVDRAMTLPANNLSHGGLFTSLCGEDLSNEAKQMADMIDIETMLEAAQFDRTEIKPYKRKYKKVTRH